MTIADMVARERTRLGIALITRGIAASLAVTAIVVAGGTVLFGGARWITNPSGPLLVWTAVLALVGIAGWWTQRDMRGAANGAAVAAAIERERSLRTGSLRGVLEVAESGPFGRLAAAETAKRLSATGRVLAPALHQRAWRRGAIAAAAAAGGVVLLTAARSSSPDGWRALRHPVMAWTGALLPPLAIVDAPRHVLRGERLRLHISAPERKRVELYARSMGAAWTSQELEVDRGNATALLGPLDADILVVAADGRAKTDTVLIRVTDRPFVGDVAIRANYPPYLGRAPEAIAVGEPARVPRGTVLAIRGRASATLRSIALVREGDTLRLEPDGHDFGGQLAAVHSGRWSWRAHSEQGPIVDVPAPLDLEVVPDSAPHVELLSPAADSVVLPETQISIQAAASDDHGVATVVMRSWRKSATGVAHPEVTQPIAMPRAPEWSGQVAIDLGPRELEPGDELHLILRATDDSPWQQSAVSRELVLRVPSLSEQRDSVRALADSVAARAAAAARTEKQLAQRTAEAARSRATETAGSKESRSDGQQSGKNGMSFQAAEQARSAAREQQKLREQVQAIERDAQALERQLRAAGALDSSLASQLQQAQAMLRDAITSDMRKELDDVMKAAQKLSASDVRRSLENLAQQQQRLREALERSAEMLKRAALEGAMETLKDEAGEIAARERSTADSLARGDSAAPRQAKELSDRSKDLSEDVEKLGKRLAQEKAEAASERMTAARDQARESADAMREAARGAEKGAGKPQTGEQRTGEQSNGERRNGEQKRGQQEQADAAREGAEKMESAAQQLSQAREQQIQEWKNDLTAELDRSIQETLQLARQQQQLAQQAAAGGREGDVKAGQSALQQGVEKAGERLQKAAGKSAHVSAQSQGAMGEARKKVQEATQQLRQSKQAKESSSAMQQAAQALNRAAASMVKDRERAAGGESASGFSEMLEKMREMAKQQGQINSQAAGLVPVPGAQMGEQQSEQARGVGRQQRGLAQRMEEAGGNDPTGRAEALAKEMRQIAEALEQGRLDPALLDRQQRLFRRMLDAGLSLEKDDREDTGKRESRSATGEEQAVPANADASGAPATRFPEPTWNEMRGLSAEERRAVLEYFKRINAERP